MSQPAHPEGLSMLEKRRIEAEILKEVYETLKASHGEEVAKRTIAESVRRSAIEQARAFAAAALAEHEQQIGRSERRRYQVLDVDAGDVFVSHLCRRLPRHPERSEAKSRDLFCRCFNMTGPSATPRCARLRSG